MGSRVLLEKPLRFTLVLQCLHGLPQEASSCPSRLPQRELSYRMFTQCPQRQSPYLNLQLGREDSVGKYKKGNFPFGFHKQTVTKALHVNPKSKDSALFHHLFCFQAHCSTN